MGHGGDPRESNLKVYRLSIIAKRCLSLASSYRQRGCAGVVSEGVVTTGSLEAEQKHDHHHLEAPREKNQWHHHGPKSKKQVLDVSMFMCFCTMALSRAGVSRKWMPQKEPPDSTQHNNHPFPMTSMEDPLGSVEREREKNYSPCLLSVHVQLFHRLTNDQLVLLGEVVFGDLEVEGSGSSPDAAGDVVVGTVARAEPSTVVTGLANGHATQMCADACRGYLNVSHCSPAS